MWLVWLALGCSSPPVPPPAPPEPHWVKRTDAELAVVLRGACDAAVADGEPVLIEFSAPWCVDCRALEALERHPDLAREYGAWRRVRVDVGRFDRHPALLAAFEVRAIAAWVALRPTDCTTPVETWPRLGSRLVELDSGAAKAEGAPGLIAWLVQTRG